jgi:hypothetical protein
MVVGKGVPGLSQIPCCVPSPSNFRAVLISPHIQRPDADGDVEMYGAIRARRILHARDRTDVDVTLTIALLLCTPT